MTVMHYVGIIGSLGTNDVTAVESSQQSMDMAVRLLQTPAAFWVIIIAGVVLSPWMVRNPATPTLRQRITLCGLSAVLFLAALLLFLLVRHRFISIFTELRPSPVWFLVFPFELGASSIGAALLVLAWYYVHPVAWFRPRAGAAKTAILRSLVPMLLTIVGLGLMIVVSFFMLLVAIQ